MFMCTSLPRVCAVGCVDFIDQCLLEFYTHKSEWGTYSCDILLWIPKSVNLDKPMAFVQFQGKSHTDDLDKFQIWSETQTVAERERGSQMYSCQTLSYIGISRIVPQGSILGPMLLTIYINKLCHGLTSAVVHFYANNSVIDCWPKSVARTFEHLRFFFDSFQSQLLQLLDASKTKGMLFSNKKKVPTFLPAVTTRQGVLQGFCTILKICWNHARCQHKRHKSCFFVTTSTALTHNCTL